MRRTLEVSASALFYSPEEKAAGGDAVGGPSGREEAPFREAAGEKPPGGNTVFTLVDTVVTEELAKTGLAIRNRIRRGGKRLTEVGKKWKVENGK